MKKLIISVISFMLVLVFLCVTSFALTLTYNVSEPYLNSIYYKRLCEVELTHDPAKDITAIALSQEGYHEGNSYYDLGGGNTSGYADYTEYCSWYGRRVAWCALFISWCARQAGIPEDVIKTNITASGNTCQFGETKYAFGAYEPKPGDIVYVDNDSDPQADHVGLVTGIDDEYIYTIEGNLSAKVYAIKYYRDTGTQYYIKNSRIVFYGVPKYNLDKNPEILMGDIDGSGKLTASDALDILDHIVGLRPLTKEKLKRADMNSDGKVDASDALCVLDKCVGK